MRLAQVMLAKGFGGAERAFVDLCHALAARGHAVLAIGETRGAALTHLNARDGIECAPVRCHGAWDPLCRRRVERLLRQFRPDLLQAHLARAAAIGGAGARSLGIPTLAKTHNLVNTKYYRAIDLLVPTTAEQYTHLLAHGVPAARLRHIPNFRALPVGAPAKTPASRNAVVKALGRFVPKKGFDVLLRAAALPCPGGVGWRLEIAGEGPERSALQALAGSLGIGDRVKFPGWVDDVASYLADADVFVLPSRIEPFGIALLEAMACGVPVVATRVSGPLEILDEETACFVAPDDPSALAGAITAVLAEPEAARARASAALARFAQCYSEDVVVQQYLAAYADLIDG